MNTRKDPSPAQGAGEVRIVPDRVKGAFHLTMYAIIAVLLVGGMLYSRMPLWGRGFLAILLIVDAFVFWNQLRFTFSDRAILIVDGDGVRDCERDRLYPWEDLSQFGMTREENLVIKFADKTPEIVISIDGRQFRERRMFRYYLEIMKLAREFAPEIYISEYEDPLEKKVAERRAADERSRARRKAARRKRRTE